MTTTTETATALSETERWQIGEARDLLACWDRARGVPGIYGTERTLADAVRSLLPIVDHVATELARQLQATRDVDDLRMAEIGELRRLLSERDALVIAALDEAAENRTERASVHCQDCSEVTLAAEEAGELDVFRAEDRDRFAGLCETHRNDLDMAEQYRAERDRREAGR